VIQTCTDNNQTLHDTRQTVIPH